jgi:hypothetical protein
MSSSACCPQNASEASVFKSAYLCHTQVRTMDRLVVLAGLLIASPTKAQQVLRCGRPRNDDLASPFRVDKRDSSQGKSETSSTRLPPAVRPGSPCCPPRAASPGWLDHGRGKASGHGWSGDPPVQPRFSVVLVQSLLWSQKKTRLRHVSTGSGSGWAGLQVLVCIPWMRKSK